MKRIVVSLLLLALLGVAWVLVLDDLAAAGKRAAIYHLHQGETVLAYPGVVMRERVRNFGVATDVLNESSQHGPKRRGGKRVASEQPPSLDEVLARKSADTLSSKWLGLTPDRRWSLYSSPEMRLVFLGTTSAIDTSTLVRGAGNSIHRGHLPESETDIWVPQTSV